MRNISKAAAAVLGLALWVSMASAASTATATLHWTAPGDDSLTGQAATYDLRYAQFPITESNFLTASRWPTSQPLPSGSEESCTIAGLSLSAVYYFALKTADSSGNWSDLSNVAIKATADSVGPPSSGSSVALQFSSPQPNPARGSAAFTMGLPRAEDVDVAAYDVHGRMVKTLLSGVQSAGQLRLAWNLDAEDGRQVPAGVYLVRARIGGRTFDRRVVVVR